MCCIVPSAVTLSLSIHAYCFLVSYVCDVKYSTRPYSRVVNMITYHVAWRREQ